jgi:hypothetical protein
MGLGVFGRFRCFNWGYGVMGLDVFGRFMCFKCVWLGNLRGRGPKGLPF